MKRLLLLLSWAIAVEGLAEEVPQHRGPRVEVNYFNPTGKDVGDPSLGCRKECVRAVLNMCVEWREVCNNRSRPEGAHWHYKAGWLGTAQWTEEAKEKVEMATIVLWNRLSYQSYLEDIKACTKSATKQYSNPFIDSSFGEQERMNVAFYDLHALSGVMPWRMTLYPYRPNPATPDNNSAAAFVAESNRKIAGWPQPAKWNDTPLIFINIDYLLRATDADVANTLLHEVLHRMGWEHGDNSDAAYSVDTGHFVVMFGNCLGSKGTSPYRQDVCLAMADGSCQVYRPR